MREEEHEEHEELKGDGKTGYWVLSAFVFLGKEGRKKAFSRKIIFHFNFFVEPKGYG